MAKYELVLPKMGEGIIEATINKWLKEVGEKLSEDDAIVEVATDKVDSEVPSPVDGVLVKTLFEEGDVAPVGDVIAIIETEGEGEEVTDDADKEITDEKDEPVEQENNTSNVDDESVKPVFTSSKRFLSPLVKSIAKKEGVSLEELESIKGSGKDNRLVKNDLLDYLKNRGSKKTETVSSPVDSSVKSIQAPPISINEGDEVVEMDRMRRLIADHMVMSSHVSPHVTSFIDVDVTNIVNWRNKIKETILKREGEKITFTPVFINAAAQALMEFPQVNASANA